MHLVVFVYYALTHYLLWDNDDYAGCTFSRMEKEINIFSTNILISTFLTVFIFKNIYFLVLGPTSILCFFGTSWRALRFFVFYCSTFYFSLSRVLFARCVLPLYCVQLHCGLFYFIEAFSVMHGTDFCALLPY